MSYLRGIVVKGKKLGFPTFFPDATRGVVRTIDSQDLEKTGIKGVIVNTFHLMVQPGDKFLSKYGGIKRFMNWNGWVVSDSGGFQIMSLIHRGGGKGKITSKGVSFQGKKLTPEKSIQVQFNLKVDGLIALDYFTPPKAKPDEIKKSVDLTIEWAKRAKEEYQRQLKVRKIKDEERPFFLAVIQGGLNKKERERCANELLKMGFDGYGFGGWPVDKEGNLDLDLTRFNADLTPDNKIRFALGVGTPWDIINGYLAGYHIFDCVLPTRDARHRRLYLFKKDLKEIKDYILAKPKPSSQTKEFFEYFYPLKPEFHSDKKPISRFCPCHTCENYSRAYLHHLFKIGDSLAYRLATIHNLTLYSRLIKVLKQSIG